MWSFIDFFQPFLIKNFVDNQTFRHLFKRFWFHKLNTLNNFRLLQRSYLGMLYKKKCAVGNVGCFAELSGPQCILRLLCGEQMIHFTVLSATSLISSKLVPSALYIHFNKWHIVHGLNAHIETFFSESNLKNKLLPRAVEDPTDNLKEHICMLRLDFLKYFRSIDVAQWQRICLVSARLWCGSQNCET